VAGGAPARAVAGRVLPHRLHPPGEGQLQFFSELESLRESQAFRRYLAPLRHTEWVVYAKPPFGGPDNVLEYLGRYTHRVAISNQRLLAHDGRTVSFSWKNYRHHHKRKIMTLDADEFLRRFLLHALPPGFQRIRHYGLMANRFRHRNLALCRRLLALSDATEPETDRLLNLSIPTAGPFLRRCPACGSLQMIVVGLLPPVWSFDSS
jgi:hypothetical protein